MGNTHEKSMKIHEIIPKKMLGKAMKLSQIFNTIFTASISWIIHELLW